MSRAIAGSAITILCMIGGAGMGYAYAMHRIALNITHMREHWGWVCGTGLDMPIYVWTPVGALMGIAVGVFLIVIGRHLRRRHHHVAQRA